VALIAPSQAEWQPPPEDIELMSQPIRVEPEWNYDPIKQFEAEFERERGWR